MNVDMDHAYSPSRWSHRFSDGEKVIESHVQTLTDATRLARNNLFCLSNWIVNSKHSYPDHAIDVYFPPATCESIVNFESPKIKAIFVYIHGGYWQFFSRNESGFMAQTMANHQIATAVIGYPIAPHATINEIVSCVEESFLKILFLATKLSVKVYVCGHSAGGHLVATLMLVNWKTKYGISHELFGGCFLVSGVFDLVPLLSTYVNKPIGMTLSDAENQSPLHRGKNDYWLELNHLPIFCIHAQYDPPVFRDQNRRYASYLEEIGFDNVKAIELNDFDHFDVIEQLEKPDQPLTTIILKAINDSV